MSSGDFNFSNMFSLFLKNNNCIANIAQSDFLVILADIFLFKIFFLMWTLFRVFIEFVTILFLYYVLGFWPGGMWDLNSLTRELT